MNQKLMEKIEGQRPSEAGVELGIVDLDLAVEGDWMERPDIGSDSESVAEDLVTPSEPAAPTSEPEEEFLWTSMHEAMLMAEIQDNDWGGPHLAELTMRLRSTFEELCEIKAMIPEQVWFEKRSEVILELEKHKQRGMAWDKLEMGVLEKLSRVMVTRSMTTGELLAIARVANSATRRGIGVEPVAAKSDNPGFNVQIINGVAVQVPSANGLPGPGSIGTIKLTLSKRTVAQLGQERIIDGTSERIMDNSEFLTAKDVPELNQMLEDE